MASEKVEAAIEERLIKSLDEDLNQEQVKLLESKVTTVRKLSE